MQLPRQVVISKRFFSKLTMCFKQLFVFRRKLLIIAMFASHSALAQAPARQNPEALRLSVQQFLQTQSAGLPGQISVTVGAIDPRLNLASCPVLQPFLAPGSRAWGKTTVGVRCTAPARWTLYVQANVSVVADYIASAVPLAQGVAIEQRQLMTMQGDLTTLPPGIATDMAQVIGRMANVSLPSGTPLRLDTLRSKPVVLQGQMVRLVSNGAGSRDRQCERRPGGASEDAERATNQWRGQGRRAGRSGLLI
jgi:flagella basal body P-ring formation protein FlgA